LFAAVGTGHLEQQVIHLRGCYWYNKKTVNRSKRLSWDILCNTA